MTRLPVPVRGTDRQVDGPTNCQLPVVVGLFLQAAEEEEAVTLSEKDGVHHLFALYL